MIITREWINPDSTFHFPLEASLTKEELSPIIDYWKTVLIKEGVKPKDKVGIIISFLDSVYLGVLFASFELGLKVVILPKPSNEEQSKQPKYTAHFPLDVLITNKEQYTDPFVLNFFKSNSKIVINTDTVELSQAEKINILPSPNDVFLLCTSSGSTDTPKTIEHTHNFFYDLCSVNWEPLEFTEDDRVLHLVTFNHGSALGIYFLPSIHKCKTHYFMANNFLVDFPEDQNWDNWLAYCYEHKITKVHSMYSGETDRMISAIRRSETGLPDLTIMVLSYINPKWLSVIKEGKLKKIISIFGCSEASGPLFVTQINKDTENFDPKNFGKPIEVFHEISLDQGELTVRIPTYNKTIKTEDFFEDNNGYRFVSKNKLYRIGDVEINISDIQLIFQKHTGNDVFILVDEIYSKLYAVTTNRETLRHIDNVKTEISSYYNNKIVLDNCFYVETLDDFVVGIKPDREKMLAYIKEIQH